MAALGKGPRFAAVLLPRQRLKLARGAEDKEHAMSEKPNSAIAVIGIDIGKNSFHVVGHDARGAELACEIGNRDAPARSPRPSRSLAEGWLRNARSNSVPVRP